MTDRYFDLCSIRPPPLPPMDTHPPQSYVCDEVAAREVKVLQVRGNKRRTALLLGGGLLGALLHGGGGGREGEGRWRGREGRG